MHYREKSNLILGIIGAILGDVLGIVIYLGMHRYYVRGVLGGTALCLLVFLGYQLFGGRMDVKGMVICSLLCIISIYPTELAAVTLDIIDEMKKQNININDGSYWRLYKRIPRMIPVLGNEYKFMHRAGLIGGYIMFVFILLKCIAQGGIKIRGREPFGWR